MPDNVDMRPHSPRALGAACALVAGLSGCSTHDVARAPQLVPAEVTAPQVSSLPAFGAPVRPDVLVTGRLTAAELRKVRSLGRAVVFSTGVVRINGTAVPVASVDPTTFRAFAAPGTAELTALWQVVASGQLVAAHAVARRLHLPLGGDVTVSAPHSQTLRLGGLATTGIPGTDLVVDTSTGRRLGALTGTAVLLSAGRGDPSMLAVRAKAVAGAHASVGLLKAEAGPRGNFVTGTTAASAFGSFWYRLYPDGKVVIDPAWEAANIMTAPVPIFGDVTCNRLMFPQLRGALQEVVQEGLARTLHTYDGCFVPKLIEKDPNHTLSLHTWGIAIDLDASTNQRGTKGTMDPRVVAIFKRWGFRWGGDWHWTDPMHFELVALLRS